MTAKETVDRFYAVVASILEFDRDKIFGVASTVILPTDLEHCYLGNYYRTYGNVRTLCSLTNPHEFQAVSMIARNLFETAVEMRLIQNTPGAVSQIAAWHDVEKLRIARRIIAFKTANPGARIDDTIYRDFERTEAARIDAAHTAFWPKLRKVKHWSGIQTLSDRCAKIGGPFREWYEAAYSQMSWYVHSGMIGIAGVAEEGLLAGTAVALNLAAKAYCDILEVMIEEFHVAKIDPMVRALLKFARVVPFANDDNEARRLYRELGLDRG